MPDQLPVPNHRKLLELRERAALAALTGLLASEPRELDKPRRELAELCSLAVTYANELVLELGDRPITRAADDQRLYEATMVAAAGDGAARLERDVFDQLEREERAERAEHAAPTLPDLAAPPHCPAGDDCANVSCALHGEAAR